MAAPPVSMDQFLQNAYKSGQLTNPSDALIQLRQHPRTFLRAHPLEIEECYGASRVVIAYLANGPTGHRPGTVLGTFRMHRAESFKIWTVGIPRETSPVTRRSFNAHYIGLGTADDREIGWYDLSADADVVITTKLTGCTFVVRSHMGVVQAAHIQPTANVDGVTLNRNLAVPGQQAWGRLKYDLDTRTVTVIGVRVSGNWKIYAQKLEKGTWNVLSVHRIFPPE